MSSLALVNDGFVHSATEKKGQVCTSVRFYCHILIQQHQYFAKKGNTIPGPIEGGEIMMWLGRGKVGWMTAFLLVSLKYNITPPIVARKQTVSIIRHFGLQKIKPLACRKLLPPRPCSLKNHDLPHASPAPLPQEMP